jgi:hypothetical protein
MILLHRIAIVVTLLVLNACDSPTSSVRSDIPMEGVAAYFPVSVGNTWVYASTDQDGKLTATDTVVVASVEGDVAILQYGSDAYEMVYRITEDSVTHLGVYAGVPEYSDDLIRTPVSVGTKWDTHTSVCRIVAVDTTVSTHAGVFDNVVTVWSQEVCRTVVCPMVVRFPRLMHYANGVGFIKSEVFVDGEFGRLIKNTRSLVSYNR